MNRIYRIIFNRSTGVFQVVCELAKSSRPGRSKSRVSRGATASLSSAQKSVHPSKFLASGLALSLFAAFSA